MHRQVGALRKILSQQAIGVLVRSTLPRALRIAKIDVDVGRQRKSTMSRQFLAPVPGQGRTIRRARSRMARHLCDVYPFIAQKTREPDLLRPAPGQASNARTGPPNEGPMQRQPPFSRRRSPNRPSLTSIDMKPPSTRPTPTRESAFADLRNKDVCIR